jgi:ADP-ribose pyrophosphatase
MNIPKEAKLMFKGILFDTYQWNQKQFDGSVKTFEMIKRKSTVDIVCAVNNKFMVLLQEQPNRPVYWSLPGGRVEEGEEPINTAKRELLEETGYEAKHLKLLFEWFGTSKMYFHESLILARNCTKVANQNLDSGEKISVKFVNFEEFLTLVCDPLFIAPMDFKLMICEALIDDKKRKELERLLLNKNK